MIEFLWFFCGALSYQILSKLLRISHTTILIKDLQINVIKFLGVAVQDVAFIQALKYKLMAEAQFPEEYLINEKKLDEEGYVSWKEEVVKKLHESVSPAVSANLSFTNWQELINILDRYYKDEKQEQ